MSASGGQQGDGFRPAGGSVHAVKEMCESSGGQQGLNDVNMDMRASPTNCVMPHAILYEVRTSELLLHMDPQGVRGSGEPQKPSTRNQGHYGQGCLLDTSQRRRGASKSRVTTSTGWEVSAVWRAWMSGDASWLAANAW